MSKKPKPREDKMDGAFFPWEKEKTPQDYLDGPDGLRRGQTSKPSGEVVIRLTDGIADKCLPPRFTWSKGHWKSTSGSYKTEAWNTWVVSAEGTPGNYKSRNYVVPDEIGQQATPKHPADWPKDLQEGSKETKWKTTSSVSSGLPWDLRVRCPGCGHFYKMNDVGDHAKNACPAEQDEPVMWIIGCECHKDDLLAATKVMDGFPIKPQPKEEPQEEIADELKQAAARKTAPDNVREEALKGD